MTKEGDGTPKKRDNLEAARTIRDALDGFSREEQERILRWARESVGLSSAQPPTSQGSTHSATMAAAAAPQPQPQKTIKDFIDEKNPQTDIQLATAIAYFYRFEAPSDDRKDEIDASTVREACRLAGRPGKLVKPLATLNNAHAKGFLDRGSKRGAFSINSVGENLVGMTLPGNGSSPARRPAHKPSSRKARTRKTRNSK